MRQFQKHLSAVLKLVSIFITGKFPIKVYFTDNSLSQFFRRAYFEQNVIFLLVSFFGMFCLYFLNERRKTSRDNLESEQ